MEPPQLTLEQQFTLKRFSDEVPKLTKEQSQEMLIEVYRQMMVKETMYRQILKGEWGISQ